MAIDLKYGKVTIEKVPGNPLGEDEPVFVLRGRDKTAVRALMAYEAIASYVGAPEEMRLLIRETIEQFIQWQSDNVDLIKIPD